jgi:hypothetical protein
MDRDGVRPSTSFPDKMGISSTIVLHSVRAGSMPRVCTVCARRVGSRLVLKQEHDVSVGSKPSRPSNAVEARVGASCPTPSTSRPGAEVSHAGFN